jgi:hypothetical protein
VAVRRRDCEQEQSRDGRDAREQAVEAVQEVDRVHHAEIPDQRQRIVDPERQVDVAPAGNVEARNVEPVYHRNDRDHDLCDELVARSHAHHVVPNADEHDQRAAEEQAEKILGIVRAVKQRRVQRETDRYEQRTRQSQIDRDAADPRLGLGVHPAFVDFVEHADLQR